MDAVEGCGTAHLTIENEKRKHLINTGQYTDALLLHDIALSYGTQSESDLQYGVVRSLHKSGMHNLALRYIKSLPESDELNYVKYECLSFLGKSYLLLFLLKIGIICCRYSLCMCYKHYLSDLKP